MKWTLDVGVNVEKFRKVGPTHWIYQIDDRLTKAVGSNSVSSGCGFGVRDTQWEFDTEAEAEAALQAIGKEFREAELDYANTYENDEYDDDGNYVGEE
jgi:hypothetical protein